MSKAQVLTQAQCAAIFGVSYVTMQNWRRGIATRDPFPEVPAEKRSNPRQCEFPLAGVKAWAKKYDLPLVRSFDDVLAGNPKGKPGPKTKITASKKVSASAAKKPKS